MKPVSEYQSLEDIIADSLCIGPLNQAADRARKNVRDYVGYKMIEKQDAFSSLQSKFSLNQKIALWILVGLCFANGAAVILFLKFLYKGN